MLHHFIRLVSLEALQISTLLILAGVPYIYWASSQIYAAELTDRSVTISTAVPSATATDVIQATVGSVNSVGSIEFQYCVNSPLLTDSCTAPAGLSLTNASLTSQTGNTGFSIDSADSTSNTIILSRAAAPALAVASSYTFSDIVNPLAANQTTFVRISTYASTNAVGSYIDDGAVAFSTSTPLNIAAYVPPFLNLCVGVTVSLNCSQATGTNLDMGILSSQTTGTAASQLSASTNSVNGYSLFVLGSTMISGNNVIPANNTPLTSQKGTGQFGINLEQNSVPAVGQNSTGAGTATPSPGYNTPNLFTFVSGTEIASSTESTDFNLMTVSYITNVTNSQPAGIYNTTLTYMASTQF